MEGPKPRTTETEKGANTSSSGENQWGFSTVAGRERHLLETKMPPFQVPRSKHTSLRNTLPGPPTMGDTILLCSGPAEGYAGYTQQQRLGCSFSGEALGRDSVIELCSFGKGTILPHLQPTASALPTCSITRPALPVCGSHPAEFSYAGESECHAKLEISKHRLLWRLLSRNQMDMCWAVWLHYKGTAPVYPASSTHTIPGRGRSTHNYSYTLFGSAFPRPCAPALLSSVLRGKQRSAWSTDIWSVPPSKAIVWDWNKVLDPLLQTWPEPPPTRDSIDLFSQTQWLHPAEFSLAEGKAVSNLKLWLILLEKLKLETGRD